MGQVYVKASGRARAYTRASRKRSSSIFRAKQAYISGNYLTSNNESAKKINVRARQLRRYSKIIKAKKAIGHRTSVYK